MPQRKYYLYIGNQDGEPCCLAVGRIMEVAGMQCAMLVDFIYASGAERVANSVVQRFLARGASLAGCLMLSHTQEYKLLKRHAFFKCPKKLEPQPFPLILRFLNSEWNRAEIGNINRWFFTMGDYDAI